jgi:hypothetical protein
MPDEGRGGSGDANALPPVPRRRRRRLSSWPVAGRRWWRPLSRHAVALSLADEKLQLEIGVLRLQKQALGEAAGLHATDDVMIGLSKGQLELNKLHNDLLKARAEAKAAGTTPRVEWLKAWGGLGALVAAFAAIATFAYSIQTHSADDDNRFRADASHLIDSLGDSSETKRAAAAIALRLYTADSRTQLAAVGALAYALGAETSLDVQHAIAASLVEAGAPARDLLRDVVSRENAIVASDFDKVGDKCTGLTPERASELTRLRARQSAVILAAEAISSIDIKRGAKSIIDLSHANLKCYEFYRLPNQFDQVDLTDAGLSGASLYHKSLKGAVLTHAEAINAELNFADLTGATVTDADFAGADMQCVTLVGTKGLTMDQLAHAKSIEGARLDKGLDAALRDATNPRGAKPCEY